MSTQISLKLSDKLFERAKAYSELKGFDNLQELIRELLREKLFDDESIPSGLSTYLASEEYLAKAWLSREEDEAWKHLQKAT